MRMRTLGAAIALLMLAGCGGAKTQDADPALWVVKDADTTIYLFGTVHMMKPGLSWFDDGVRKAFDESDELVLELVAPPEREMQALVAELGIDPAGRPLMDQLPAESAAKLRAALPDLGMNPQALDTAEPWLAATMLSALPLRQAGYDEKDGAEAVLTAAAKSAGKRVAGLETARQQLGYFDALSPAVQRALLVDTIDALPTAATTVEKMTTAWAAGDADTLARLMNEDLAGAPELSARLLSDRNRNWAGWISRRMRRPGTVFVAVGAGHLAGGASVQAQLAKRGLKAERVDY